VSLDGSQDADADELAGWRGGLADPAEDVEAQVAVSGILAAVQRAVHALPWQAQVVLAMRYWEGLPLSDIAEALGLAREHALQLHTDAILRVHEEMLAAAAG
jgi:DNA-directed RNA polymerase specialized sigma subunit